eukprot:m.281139 g.281139  ORF g.281139 m.281139 type:complete len:83 (-) comp22886_c2_seq13:59-307(-)
MQDISTFAIGASSVLAIDLNSDVLSVSYTDDTIAWYRNSGGNNPTFTTMPAISAFVDGAYAVFAIDLNGDTHPASFNDNKIA